eukprot:TRINITY_DN10062_c0_g1_i1.p1 TRINITY_DN10062_c0_g1~~TRINITY_DN10062_c0_g1_i1.p1  ORF type:complete len:332 (+),score=55.42 TRINITY_DN10062_c0_g1_i1:83-997(+)
MTGTVLSGKVAVNDMVELPANKVQAKVKSIQMFHKPVKVATQGDRIGMCVKFDAKMMERGLVCSPGGIVQTIAGAIINVTKIKYFSGSIRQKTKLHVTVGYTTVMATSYFFSHETKLGEKESTAKNTQTFDYGREYLFQPSVFEKGSSVRNVYAALLFEKPIICPKNAIVIVSRLDTDIHANTCRLAFYGRVLAPTSTEEFKKVNIYKNKSKSGTMIRVFDDNVVIASGMFQKGVNINDFTGMRVTTAEGIVGRIESPFGKTGKFKVRFQNQDKSELAKLLQKGRGLTYQYRYFMHAKKKFVQD